MNIQEIIAMAQQAARVIDSLTGTQYAGAAVKVGETVMDLIDNVKEVSGASQEELQASRDALVERVNAHADETINRLGD
jgi:hypothetical protein